MSDQTTTTQNFIEAPASWNTRYISKNGFTCQLTLRADTGQELIERANSAIAYLIEQGCQPSNGYFKNGYQEDKTQAAAEGHETPNGNNPSLCSIHGVEMKRWEKDGRVWYSHKSNDDWCTGKVKNGKK